MTETSEIHPAQQRKLLWLGSMGIRTAAATAFASKDFAPPEWYHPQQTYLDRSKAAWKLGETCIDRTDIHVLIFRNATLDEVCDLQVGIQTGYAEAMAAGRALLRGSVRGELENPLDQQCEAAMGSLVVPLMNSDDLTPKMLERIVAEPALPVYALAA